MSTLEQQRELRDRNAELEQRLQSSEIRLETIERQLSERDQEITEKEHRIEKLKWEIAELKRKLFGNRQGETFSDEQLQLALAELEAERQEQEVSGKKVAGYSRRENKDRDASPRIPDHLEVVEEVIIPEEVRTASDAWERIGEEVTEELDIAPMRFVKRVIVKPKYVRKGEVARNPVVSIASASDSGRY